MARSLPDASRVLMAFGLGILALAIVCAGPLFLDTYTVNILVRAFLYAAVALTVDVLWGYTGILTFGQSAFFGIGAYAAGLLFTHQGFSPQTILLSLAGGVVVAAAVAAFVGWISFWPGASPLYVAIVTLALPIVVVQLLYSGGTFTGSSSGLVGFDTFDLSVEAWFRNAGCGLIVLTTAAWFFVNSDFGRLLVAIRENEQRSQYLGINTIAIKIGLMTVMAMVAALAGYAYACYTMVVARRSPGLFWHGIGHLGRTGRPRHPDWTRARHYIHRCHQRIPEWQSSLCMEADRRLHLRRRHRRAAPGADAHRHIGRAVGRCAVSQRKAGLAPRRAQALAGRRPHRVRATNPYRMPSRSPIWSATMAACACSMASHSNRIAASC